MELKFQIKSFQVKYLFFVQHMHCFLFWHLKTLSNFLGTPKIFWKIIKAHLMAILTLKWIVWVGEICLKIQKHELMFSTWVVWSKNPFGVPTKYFFYLVASDGLYCSHTWSPYYTLQSWIIIFVQRTHNPCIAIILVYLLLQLVSSPCPWICLVLSCFVWNILSLYWADSLQVVTTSM